MPDRLTCISLFFQLEMNRQLPWLKGVKESHGAVEVSAVALAKAINARGIYRLGGWKSKETFEVNSTDIKYMSGFPVDLENLEK